MLPTGMLSKRWQRGDWVEISIFAGDAHYEDDEARQESPRQQLKRVFDGQVSYECHRVAEDCKFIAAPGWLAAALAAAPVKGLIRELCLEAELQEDQRGHIEPGKRRQLGEEFADAQRGSREGIFQGPS